MNSVENLHHVARAKQNEEERHSSFSHVALQYNVEGHLLQEGPVLVVMALLVIVYSQFLHLSELE